MPDTFTDVDETGNVNIFLPWSVRNNTCLAPNLSKSLRHILVRKAFKPCFMEL